MTTNAPSRAGRRWWHAPKEIRNCVTIALLVCIVLFAAGCATYWYGLTEIADEGRGIIGQTKLNAEPEAKVRVAEEILVHTDKYDQLINRSIDSHYIIEVQRIQRNEREAAVLLLRAAADDYVEQHDVEKARAVYHLIVESFDQKDYEPVRQSARSALRSLGNDTTL